MRRLILAVTVALLAWSGSFTVCPAEPAAAVPAPSAPSSWKSQFSAVEAALLKDDSQTAGPALTRLIEMAEEDPLHLGAQPEIQGLQWVRLGMMASAAWEDEKQALEQGKRCYAAAEKALGKNSPNLILAEVGKDLLFPDVPLLGFGRQKRLEGAHARLAHLMQLAYLRVDSVRWITALSRSEVSLPLKLRFAFLSSDRYDAAVDTLGATLAQREAWPITSINIPFAMFDQVEQVARDVEALPGVKPKEIASLDRLLLGMINATVALSGHITYPYAPDARDMAKGLRSAQWRTRSLQGASERLKLVHERLNRLEVSVRLHYLHYVATSADWRIVANQELSAESLIPPTALLSADQQAWVTGLLPQLGQAFAVAQKNSALTEVKLDFTVSATPTPRPYQAPIYERKGDERITCDICRGRGYTTTQTDYSNSARVTCWRCKGKGWRTPYDM